MIQCKKSKSFQFYYVLFVSFQECRKKNWRKLLCPRQIQLITASCDRAAACEWRPPLVFGSRYLGGDRDTEKNGDSPRFPPEKSLEVQSHHFLELQLGISFTTPTLFFLVRGLSSSQKISTIFKMVETSKKLVFFFS